MNCVLSLNVGEKYQRVYKNCVDTHKQYAEKWNYGYKLIDTFTVENVNVNFLKYDGILKCFDEGYEWVIFVDADAIINNMDIPLSHYTCECHPLQDIILMMEMPLGIHIGLYGCLNGGVYIMRNTEWSRSFLRELISIGKNIPDKKVTDQDVLNHVVRENPRLIEKFLVHQWDRKHSINGYISVNARTAHRDDFIIHFLSSSNDEELLDEYINLKNRNDIPTFVFHKDDYPLHWEKVRTMYPCLMDWPMYGFR